MAETVVSIQNLHKYFGDLEVLKGVDLDVRRGGRSRSFGRSVTSSPAIVHVALTPRTGSSFSPFALRSFASFWSSGVTTSRPGAFEPIRPQAARPSTIAPASSDRIIVRSVRLVWIVGTAPLRRPEHARWAQRFASTFGTCLSLRGARPATHRTNG